MLAALGLGPQDLRRAPGT